MNIILASASERRQELLHRIVDDFNIMVSEFDESKVKYNGILSEYVEEIALGKAKSISEKVKEKSIIIAADTIVAFDNHVLGKPKSEQEAYEMLSRLSDNVHEVYTGVVLINTENGKVLKDSVKTSVVFSKLSEKDIREYVKSKDPMDKAGAYGIQGKAGVFVKEIRGCYYNVVGLPLNKLKEMIEKVY